MNAVNALLVSVALLAIRHLRTVMSDALGVDELADAPWGEAFALPTTTEISLWVQDVVERVDQAGNAFVGCPVLAGNLDDHVKHLGRGG